jgi:Ca-activated chloride channel homolog
MNSSAKQKATKRGTIMNPSMSMRTTIFVFALAGASTACGGDDSGDFAAGEGGGGAGVVGVGQGGAQDFGQFRQILDRGEIPGPQTLDDVGFFNEHKLELPAPDCDDTVCLHGQLGVMGNMITGSNCTLVLLGMNTPVDPSRIERPPLNLAVAIDTSGSMAGEPIAYVREGLFRMLDALSPEDRVSIVTFDNDAELVAESASGDSAELTLAIDGLRAGGMTNLYAGLRTAYQVVEAHADPDRQNRVILLSDGEATTGIVNDERLVEMSRLYNAAGLGLSTIGVGQQFDPTLMRRLTEAGSGAFYFLEDSRAVEEVFEEEVHSFLVPLAQDLRIDLDIDEGYWLRAVYGTKLFELGSQSAVIEIPSVQIAHRQSVSEQDGVGRRGGGGAIIAELVPRSTATVQDPGTVGRLAMRYRVPGEDRTVEHATAITSPLSPGEIPEGGHFSGGGVEKAFVMLNIFAGFQMASMRASIGDEMGALGVLEPLAVAVESWLLDNPDHDIADDLGYIHKFIANLRARGAQSPPPEKHPPEPWPAD